MLSALLSAGRSLTVGLFRLSTADSILMSSRYHPLRFRLSAIPHLPHFLPIFGFRMRGVATG